MKKFDARMGIRIASMDFFKKGIYDAVEFAERGRNEYSNGMGNQSLAFIVTYNPEETKINIFEVRGYSSSEEQDILDHLTRIEKNEKYSQNELVTVIRTSRFEYEGYTGYSNQQERELSKLKLEKMQAEIYIEVLTGQ